MDAPPPKRRRTSPRLAGRASSDGPDAAAPGTSNDHDTANTPTDLPPGSPGSFLPRSKIPLFASPTRASLARHNPDILERRRSASRGPSLPPQGPGVDGTDGAVRPLQQPALRSPVRSRRSALSRSPSRGLSQSPTRSPARSPSRRPGGLFSEPPVQSPVRGQPQGGSGTDGPIDGGSLRTALPQRTPVKKPVPRPLPPPEPTRAEDVLEPLVEAARERQRRAAAASGGSLDLFRVQQEEPAEPELPPTPEHPDPALTTSPPGIHNVGSSTPSKRPPRQRSGRPGGTALPGGKTNAPSSSSPLKQPPLKPPQNGAAAVAKPAFSKATAQKKRTGKEPSASVAAGEKNPTVEIRGDGRVTRSAAVRGIKPADPDEAKKKERDALLAEIAELEADLVLAGAENERIRTSVEEAGGPAQRSETGQPPPPHVREDLLGLLRRRAPSVAPTNQDAVGDTAMASWLQGATNPIAFLPFGKPAGADGLSALLEESPSNEEEAAAAIPSHRPLSMTAAEELPYLQAFTPLVFSSDIVLLPGPAETPVPSRGLPPPPLLQMHRIAVASAHPHSSLFRARLEMTVNATSLRVTDLRVPRIEPLAAAAELQPLLAWCGVSGADEASPAPDSSSSSSSSSSSALLRNVTILTWAMGEWVRVAVRRARFWAALERRLREKPGGAAGERDAAAAVAWRRPRARKRKRGQARAARRQPDRKHGEEGTGLGGGEGDDTDDDSEDGGDDGDDDLVVSEAELLAHAGRTAMDVDVPMEEQPPSSSSSAGGGGGSGRGLRVEWTVHFDWTGEARSQISLLVGVPGKWRKADDRGRLAALPRLFNELVHGNTDPAAAVETVVALLADSR